MRTRQKCRKTRFSRTSRAIYGKTVYFLHFWLSDIKLCQKRFSLIWDIFWVKFVRQCNRQKWVRTIKIMDQMAKMIHKIGFKKVMNIKNEKLPPFMKPLESYFVVVVSIRIIFHIVSLLFYRNFQLSIKLQKVSNFIS